MARYLITDRAIWFGCDPEVFVSYEAGRVRKRQSIVGSEVILPPDGKADKRCGSLVRDGVQIELHPVAQPCRATVSNNLQVLFRMLEDVVKERSEILKKPLKISFDQVVRLSKGDLSRLSGDSQQLGCVESLNVYGRKHIQKDGRKYLYRSGAGHIHMGINLTGIDPKRFVRLLDVLVGVMMVLVDRNPMAAFRRRLYGRAGEYRLPKHGLEYRTPSNFWLHNYRLMGMVMGMARLAWHVAQGEMLYAHRKKSCTLTLCPDNLYMYDAEQRIMEKVDLEQVETAINTSNWEMAMEIYKTAVRPQLSGIHTVDTGVGCENVENFDFFVQRIREAELAGDPQPLSIWFPEDPLKHWLGKPEGHGTGFERFLLETVAKERLAATKISGVIQTPTIIETPIYIPAPAVIEPAIIEATV